MATSNSKIIKEPYNELDPKVVFDPTFGKRYVAKQFDDGSNKNLNEGNETNNLKDDAINIPVIKLNNIILHDENIDYMYINYDGFLPTIHLSVKDDENYIQVCDTPGFDNFISVVIITEVNGYYKKVSLTFYITKYKIYDNYISYDGIYKYKALNNDMFKQIGDKKLSTYEMLEEIAKETKLGFAATKDCKDIKDETYRLIQSQNYVDFIESQMDIAGVDEKTILDCWVDLFGYIVLVNIYYVLNEKIEPENLTIYSMVGLQSTIESIPSVSPVLLQRTLTNEIINQTDYNLLFNKYENIVNNTKIYNEGALNQGYYMTSPGLENTIANEELQMIENSLDGAVNSEEYEFKNVQFLGIEFEDTSVLFKKRINKKFFDKIRTRRLKIELTNYNLGLERGTLVNVVFKEYNNGVVKTISKNEEIEDTAGGAINPFSTGMYYIDGMEFEYKTENNKITQYLYLIKRGSITSPLNTTMPAIETNEQ